MIVKEDKEYVLYSKDGKKKLGHGTEQEMKMREKQIQTFKHMKDKHSKTVKNTNNK